MSQHLFTQNDMISQPIVEGDAGVVLKSDGTFRLFNTHKDLDPQNLTEAQLRQGTMLVGLSIALKNPAVMNMLIQMSNDPDVCDQDRLVAAPRLNS